MPWWLWVYVALMAASAAVWFFYRIGPRGGVIYAVGLFVFFWFFPGGGYRPTIEFLFPWADFGDKPGVGISYEVAEANSRGHVYHVRLKKNEWQPVFWTNEGCAWSIQPAPGSQPFVFKLNDDTVEFPRWGTYNSNRFPVAVMGEGTLIVRITKLNQRGECRAP